MRKFGGAHQSQVVLLLAAAMATALDPSHSLASERSSIESTYELTKYLEYQLREIKDVYLTYLGPPFNEKDFSPPRPNSTALSLPSATRFELWKGLENQARLAQNQKAYSVLLAAVRELARSTLCPSLRTSLLHFCTGLDGLLGSISALMATLGYAALPLSSSAGAGELRYLPAGAGGGERPAPLMSQSLYRSRGGTRAERNNQRRGGARVVRGEREEAAAPERKRGKAGRRAEAAAAAGGGRSGGGVGSREKARGVRRGRREEPESWRWAPSEEDEHENEEGAGERWGHRRRLLSIEEEDGRGAGPAVGVSFPAASITLPPAAHQYSYTFHHPSTLRKEDGVILDGGRGFGMEDGRAGTASVSFSPAHQERRGRPARSLLPPTLPPPLSTLSLLYQFGAGEEHTLLPQPIAVSLRRGAALLSPPLTPLLSSTSSSTTSSSSSSSSSSLLLSVRPTMNDFARKVEGFWILRELQSWLWRSAKDFNRLKNRRRG